MDRGNSNLREGHSSIKYNWSPVGKSSSEIADFPSEEYASALSQSIDKKHTKRSNPKIPEILSTGELVSAVGQIWDYATRPLGSSRNGGSIHDSRDRKDEVTLAHLDSEGSERLNRSSSSRTSYFCVDLRSASQSSSQKKTASDFTKVTEKLYVSEPLGEKKERSSFWKLPRGHAKMDTGPWRHQSFPSIEISCELENVYGWMKQIAFSGSNSRPEGEGISSATKSASTGPGCDSQVVKSCNLPSLKETKLEMNVRSSLCSDYFLVGRHEPNMANLSSTVSDLYKEYHPNPIVDNASEDSENGTNDDNQSDTKGKQYEELLAEDSLKNEVLVEANRKPRFSFAKQEHAFAGAFAGVFVSLCLHPVDTVKTVVQACHGDQRSVFNISRSLVAERGLTGLYRGISANITSSAPISAIYTFTYESVKGAVLPHLSKEYYSIAHCVAGGCASVATSFVFTPSERIKQQMQVGSHYNNCWSALVGILQNGGLRSLYNGWGAVLCRNVPHSIIKFYTYESLKRLTSSSSSSSSHKTQPNPLQTVRLCIRLISPITLTLIPKHNFFFLYLQLVCGGLAGSTAAFFTTPFDVVKTRLQTQVPGAMSQYSGVTHALIEIGKKEGLKGLYSGLAPRLVMYVSQGALFFASYEFFKKFLSLETALPETESTGLREKKKEKSFIPALPLSQKPSMVVS